MTRESWALLLAQAGRCAAEQIHFPPLFSLRTSSRVPRVPEISGWRVLPVSSWGGAACSAIAHAEFGMPPGRT